MIPADFKVSFTDTELEQIGRIPAIVALDGDCPVCLGTGTYSYDGTTYGCPADRSGTHIATRLAMLYWLHNIPLQFQQLVWEEWPVDTPARVAAKETMDTYVERFKRFRLNGVGLTFYSQGLGTGKTWAATATLKRLVKAGYDGWFAPFYEVKSYYEIGDKVERDYKIARVQKSAVLVLDEVRKPSSPAQERFFADKLEELIRPRADGNLPTIITTNMTPDELEHHFPRVFSLMGAKNLLIELAGLDARLGDDIYLRNQREDLPIT